MQPEKRKRGRPRKVIGADVEAIKPKRGRPRKSALANPPAGMQKRRGRPRKNPLDNPEVKKYLFSSATTAGKWIAEDGNEVQVCVHPAGSPELQAEVAELRLKVEKKSLERFLAEGEAISAKYGADPTMNSGGPGKLTHSRAIEELEGQLAAWTKTLTERFESAEGRIASLENKVG